FSHLRAGSPDKARQAPPPGFLFSRHLKPYNPLISPHILKSYRRTQQRNILDNNPIAVNN
ncbi:hypothetical protein, partial [Klebsiella grimontii]|uniref:hypothetical protein n=1 Tax=Klebsiella grimontii TaxID=2058152 RepID=UPI001C49C7F9